LPFTGIARRRNEETFSTEGSMDTIKGKMRAVCFVLFLLFCYYGLIYQVKRDYTYFEKKKNSIEEAYAAPIAHPLLIVNPSLFEPYVKAYDLIMKSDSSRFWLVCADLDPAIMLNYQVFPKKLIMSVETQMALNWKNLARSKESIRHIPPERYDKVILIEEHSAELLDQWDGNP
jgi:hypothetical protein